MSFPLGPTNGQTATLNGIIYTYDSVNQAWTRTSPLLSLSGTASSFAVSNTAASTSTTTGALTVAGGAGIGGNLYVGGNLVVVGNTTIQNYEIITNTEIANAIVASGNITTTGSFVTTGGVFWANGAAYSSGSSFDGTRQITISNATVSTSTTTGALQVTGGVGIQGNLYVGGNVTVGNITGGGVRSTSSSTAPVNPTVGDIWYDTATDDIYRYTTDGTSSYWLDTTGPTQANSVTFLNTNIYANSFNGTSYLATTATIIPASTAFTIECWVYPTSFAAINGICGQYTAATTGRLTLDISATTGFPTFFIGDTASLSLTSSVALLLNTWAHLAVTRSGNNYVLYLNGVSVATGSATTAILQKRLVIGALDSSPISRYFSGSISNFRVVGSAVYTATFTVPTPPLTAITNTSLLTCQTIPAVDASTNAFAVTDFGGVGLSLYAAQQTPLVTLPIIPTRTILNTAGSGTYTVPAYTKWITVRMVGGGGGGGGSGTGSAQSAGGAGTNSVFDTITANAASATGTSNVQAGNGGGYTLGAYSGFGIPGASGSAGQDTGSSLTSGFLNSGAGGSSPFGGAGGAKNTGAGRDAQNNSGSGGSGGGGGYNTANFFYGPGGGAGGYVEVMITGLASSYAYTVGQGGTGGSAGTSGAAGGNGGSGIIIIEEHYSY